MRKLFILLSVIFIQIILIGALLPRALAANSTPVHANCLQIKVKFNAPAAWQKSSSNRSIQIGCDGEIKPTGAQSCEGAVLSLKPGQTKTLGNCSCFDKKGCLVVGKTLTRAKVTNKNKWDVTVDKTLDSTLGGKCSVKYTNRATEKNVKLASICGTNKQKFNIGINIKCTTPKPSVTPGVSITPTPGICVGPKPVVNVKVTCPTCDAINLSPTPSLDLLPPIAQDGEGCGGFEGPICAEGLSCVPSTTHEGSFCQPNSTTPTEGRD